MRMLLTAYRAYGFRFPDPTGGDPEGQVSSLISYLKSHGLNRGTSGKGKAFDGFPKSFY
jgi:hypothetical protein